MTVSITLFTSHQTEIIHAARFHRAYLVAIPAWTAATRIRCRIGTITTAASLFIIPSKKVTPTRITVWKVTCPKHPACVRAFLKYNFLRRWVGAAALSAIRSNIGRLTRGI